MSSIGNDIVDLNLTDADRTNQSRFYAKIITLAELQAIPYDLPLDRYVWLLWTVKEACYKYCKRLKPDLIFAPVKIPVTLTAVPQKSTAIEDAYPLQEHNITPENFFAGQALFADTTLFFRSLITNDFIATVVDADDEFKNAYWGIRDVADQSAESQSAAVRSLALERLNAFLPGQQFHFNKSHVGYPLVATETGETNILLSLAHHGRFVSYCFKLG
jgi:phosphopantetheinyl transferase (holo-ACP synthase)